MFSNNIAFKGICTLILFITMGISQVTVPVSLEIKNPTPDINTCSDPAFTTKATCEAGTPVWDGSACSDPDPSYTNQATCEAGTPYWTIFTLDIYMTNSAGCSHCSDPSGYSNKESCETLGNNGDGATWAFDASIDEATCEASDGVNGIYFSGEVKGFQFYLDGIDVAGVSGGTAEQYLDFIDFNASTNKVVGTSFSASTIPAGSDVLLTTMRFSTTGDVSCFAVNDCSQGETSPGSADGACSNVVSDSSGGTVETVWGDCYCVTDSDSDGYCDSVDNCKTVTNSNQKDTDGDGANCSGAMDEDVLLDPQPTTQVDCIKDGGTWTIVDGRGDACDACMYDSDNDTDADGICGCTLSLSECAALEEAYDNCPATATADQTNTDGDLLGDACDACPNDPDNDADNDGICGDLDNCLSDQNADQADGDTDGVGDACDNCVATANTDQADGDTDGVGDVCDNCAANDNVDQVDGDTDEVGDVCDNCVATANAGQGDADFDGFGDDCDACAGTVVGATVDADGCSSSQLSISQVGTVLPTEFSISQNFPNPFNPITSITFDVAEMDEVSLVVYDLTGKEVATLVSGTYTPGTYNVEWNAVNNVGDGIVSGMYIYRYIGSEKAITRKMLYLK